ncbi:Modification methylase DpnIIB [uncultured Clostridium sp.]|nr:Modification methylase DpnIIB [uncultured Clostridium sp.]
MTNHTIIAANSSNLSTLSDKSVNLVVTSPPYPMVEMWDKMFSEQNPEIGVDLANGDGMAAFNKMHDLLNAVWKECNRVLDDNGFVCINIGDATRTINGEFQLYSNHTKIINHFLSMGYSVLPDVHWRKQSNAPNKFMGSGMYPAGAYVTYEHEYVLIFRKGGKRVFKGTGKDLRQKSAFFWEERNVWFSDLWEIKGTSQFMAKTKASRDRNASFPFEIPYRLINMYSAEGDTVLDPFAGLGTTNVACMISNRNSIGVDIDPEIVNLAIENMGITTEAANTIIDNRIQRHLEFIAALPDDKKAKCYENGPHGFNVKTRQETAIEIEQLKSIKRTESGYECHYEKYKPIQRSEQMSLAL